MYYFYGALNFILRIDRLISGVDAHNFGHAVLNEPNMSITIIVNTSPIIQLMLVITNQVL